MLCRLVREMRRIPAAPDTTPPLFSRARRIIAAFDLAEHASRGAISLDGQMVERLHADMARRTIAIADAIAALARH